MVRIRRPRIGITGSAGTGKTTLAGDLSRTLDLPLQEEWMRGRLAAGFDFHQLTREQHRRLLSDDADLLAGHLARADGMVTDRTPLDMAAFWLANGFGVDDPAATEALLARAICAMADYSLVVLLPWGAMRIQADGVRSTNPWLQLHHHAVLEALCRRYVAGDRLLWLPDLPADPAVRCRVVRDRLATLS